MEEEKGESRNRTARKSWGKGTEQKGRLQSHEGPLIKNGNGEEKSSRIAEECHHEDEGAASPAEGHQGGEKSK